MTPTRFRQKAKTYWQLFKHFQNPLLILLARIGVIDILYCSYQIQRNGTKYVMLGRARGGDIWILREVLVEQTYSPLLKLLPDEPLRIVDVGAHVGAFTVWLGGQRRIKEAFCFEPDPDSFRLCQFNLDVNNCTYASLYKHAFGGNTRESDIWVNPIAHARSSLYNSRVSDPTLYGRSRLHSDIEHRKVSVIAFDEWLRSVQGNFDLLKMDCEGAEWEILNACPAAFTRFGIIIAEIHDDPSGVHKREDFANILRDNGFTTVNFDRLYIGCRS